jgi:predicted nuclease of predicted toxin-antitoxin system
LKIKLDENLPSGLVPVLQALGHDVDTVPGEGLSGHRDDEIAAAARGEGRFLVSQDHDFSDRRRVASGAHPGILFIRMRVPGAKALQERVGWVFQKEAVDSWAGALVVVTDSRIRISRP